MDTQLKRGLLDVCVLAAIKSHESYGYQIIKEMKPYMEISESTLYTILKRLEAADMLTVRTAEYGNITALQNGVLVIENTDARKWYDSFGVSFENETVTVYLPKAEFNSLLIKSDAGDVEIPESLSFENIQAETDTSDIVLQSTFAANSVTIKSDMGNVMLDRCDAEEITAITDSGDVGGSLLSRKTFYATSSDGNIDIPKTSPGGKCKLTTNSGNIKVSVGGRYD